MDNKIVVFDSDWKELEVEVLDIFGVKAYPSKEYILYTMNKEVDQDNIECYISLLVKDGDKYTLDSIDDPRELEIVKKACMEEEDNTYE